MEKDIKHGFWYGFNLAAIILIVFFLIGVPLLFAFAEFLTTVNISLMQKNTATVLVPSEVTLVVTNPDAIPLNAIEFELRYDTEALLVTSVLPHTALCEERFMLTNRIDHASGSTLFQCGTIVPFKNNEDVVATIQILPLRSGTSTISFGTQTHVLAHDGYGTDVTNERRSLTFVTN